MYRTFNTNGYCNPKLHYMVDLSSRLNDIKSMIDDGKYFTITRARQFGKTTILTALADFLSEDYEVISLDFQAISSAEIPTSCLQTGFLKCACTISFFWILRNRTTRFLQKACGTKISL